MRLEQAVERLERDVIYLLREVGKRTVRRGSARGGGGGGFRIYTAETYLDLHDMIADLGLTPPALGMTESPEYYYKLRTVVVDEEDELLWRIDGRFEQDVAPTSMIGRWPGDQWLDTANNILQWWDGEAWQYLSHWKVT